MSFLIAGQSDVGITKKTNQDSFSIQVAHTADHGDVCFAVVCDGMGGLALGELASATVIKEFGDWFANEFPNILDKVNVDITFLRTEWTRMIRSLNAKIGNYGLDHNIHLGTTLVAALWLDGKVYIANVGDSRAYMISDKVVRLSHDQSLVAQEIALGKLRPDQEETDSRRNVLLQCVGASQVLNPEIEVYDGVPGAVYMLCSDGFRHEITEDEYFAMLNPASMTSEAVMNSALRNIIELLKGRKESDNITGVAFKLA